MQDNLFDNTEIAFKNKSAFALYRGYIIFKIISLEEGTMLEQVEIVREMPVSIKGDTIVYNADSFKSGTERKLEDILKKLPGITVQKDGTIKAHGKTIDKLLVEGEDIFNQNYKIFLFRRF